jgi:WD40 repeat protein
MFNAVFSKRFFGGTLPLVLAGFALAAPAYAQVNKLTGVVFGERIPRFMADPRGGMPMRNTSADYSILVPNVANARAIIYSPDGSRFVTASGTSASVWSASQGRYLLTLSHDGPIRWLSYTFDGNIIVTSGGSWTRIWNGSNGEFITQFNHQSNVRQLVLSQDSKYLAITTDAAFQLWSISDRAMRLNMPVPNSILSFMFSPDAQQIVTLDGQGLDLWRTSDGGRVGRITPDQPVRAALFSPDSKYLMVGCDTMSYLWNAKGYLKVADVQYGGGYR